MDTERYEPPRLEVPDPNSDTRVPLRVRDVAVSTARIAWAAAAVGDLRDAGIEGSEAFDVAVLAAIEYAYADGYGAGIRSTELMDGELTDDDNMAYEGTLQWCGVPNPKLPGSLCNRANGHTGDHADLVEDDRAGEADPWAFITVMDRWPRETGTLILDTSGPYVESAITPQGEKG